ncbi:CCD73 protein, partial [Cercotrichas coryphoeus]|nr:CCD73 protein [Cercotrichas coryphoeus]
RMDEDLKAQVLDSTLPSPSETLLSIRLLDFKTSLLEAIEELRIRRETETNYEDQINKIVIEKQELEWQKETLQHQTDTLQQQNKEAMAAFKKQLQARMFAMEEEKGKYQLAVETKEKEIDGLKETLKALQISKYTLQKKLNEMDQKLQMHLTAKEEHHKKLNEVERCYATIASRFGIVKGVHGKLEHSVQEAIQHNKKLASVNKRQETEISNLKEELKKVTTDLIRSKVTSQYRVGEENINLAVKEKQFQELQQKIRMETAVSKKVQEENTHIKEEKLEILSSLQCVQELLQRITQANVRMESELNALKEDYQALERDNELQREKAKENEEKFLNLQNEHEKALRTWKNDEENMRREIHTIKNDLNSLKGLRYLEDYHPPQGNQHSEQVENLQGGQEHSKDSEMQDIQKENDFMQSVISKYGNCGNEEETEVKDTRDKSSSTEELKIEQSNNLPWIIEINPQVLENSFKDEINVASPRELKQREASPRNTLCTDTDLITQGHTSEMHVTGGREAEDTGTTHRTLPDDNNANLDQKPRDSTEPLAAQHTQTRKDFLGSAERKSVGADRKNGSQETDTSKEELCDTADESACAKADANSDTRQHNRSVLPPEAPKSQSEAVLCTEKSAQHERSTDNHQAEQLSFGVLPYTKENSQAQYQKCSLLNTDNSVGSGLHKAEKTLNLSGLHRDKLPLEQTQVDAEGRNDDNVRNTNDTDVATDAQHPPEVCCDDASGDAAAAKQCRENKSLLGTFNLCPPKTEREINADDMHSKQPEQGSAKQAGNAANTWTSNAEAKSPVKADGAKIAHKNPPTDRACTDKLILCKNVNSDTQIHSIKTGHSLETDASTNNTLLKEKKDPLSSTVPGTKFSEGHLKESSSLPLRTSGNLVNISLRSSFDLSTSDKKAEKTPLYLNFLAFSSCSRVNQVRGQAAWTSASKEPSLLKDKPPLENTNIISKPQSKNLSENVDSEESGQGSSSLSRPANTLNTSSIHQKPQGEPSEEWNATAKAFCDSSFPTEHVKEGLAALQNKQKSPHMTVTPANSEKALKDEDSCSLQNSIIQNQIGGIEKLLNLERLHSARKRKYEE